MSFSPGQRGYTHPEALVSTDWLAQHLSAPDIRIVDASWHMPAQKRNARAEYEARHIPGAVFFDIDQIADTESTLPHMLPSAEKFSARVRKLGLGDGTRIVVYDSYGMMSAARVWWTRRARLSRRPRSFASTSSQSASGSAEARCGASAPA